MAPLHQMSWQLVALELCTTMPRAGKWGSWLWLAWKPPACGSLQLPPEHSTGMTYAAAGTAVQDPAHTCGPGWKSSPAPAAERPASHWAPGSRPASLCAGPGPHAVDQAGRAPLPLLQAALPAIGFQAPDQQARVQDLAHMLWSRLAELPCPCCKPPYQPLDSRLQTSKPVCRTWPTCCGAGWQSSPAPAASRPTSHWIPGSRPASPCAGPGPHAVEQAGRAPLPLLQAALPAIGFQAPDQQARVQDLAHTLRTRLAEHGRFAAPKRPPTAFAVDHYAGLVTYACEVLMDKNKDFVIAEHQTLLLGSRFPLLQCARRPEPCPLHARVLTVPGLPPGSPRSCRAAV